MHERIGNCRILEEIATGGMAVVYRAIQDGLNRTVAIKALKSSVALDEQLSTRFEREAQSLAALAHENIIHVYDFHEINGERFIVMEFVQGVDLYDLLDRAGRLPADCAAIIAMQVARALDYIHYKGIVHRDIKPANIMISRPGGVKVMDFGIARDRTFEDDLTQDGTGIGTPSYMSPEQILGDKLDSRSDIFSLGIVLFQMITGRKPFIEDESQSVMHKIRIERHPRPRKLNPDCPRELERIIDRCLAKEPKQRWRSAQALTMALERFLSKHVEMNYHSRLVLLLRNQNIITKLEAAEYLNPTHSRVGASPLSQPQATAKNVFRRSLWVQLAIAAVTMVVVGIIHLAPIGVTSAPARVSTAIQQGQMDLVVYPWAEVYLGDELLAVTPIEDTISLPAGSHELTLRNHFFAPYPLHVTIKADTTLAVDIDLEKVGSRIEPRSPSTTVEPKPPSSSISDAGTP